MTKVTIVGGKTIWETKGETLIHAYDGDGKFTTNGNQHWKGEKGNIVKDYEPKAVGDENKNFIACIDFYRSLDHANLKYGKDDTGYHGQFGFDRFDKTICGEGLNSRYQALRTIIPKNNTYKDTKVYLCPYLSIWPPNIPENEKNIKSKVSLYVKANDANIKGLKDESEIEFTCSDDKKIKISPTTVKLTLNGEPQKIEIECLEAFEEDLEIIAKAKNEPQILGKLIIKANAIIYTTTIQAVEVVYSDITTPTIEDITHDDYITELEKYFNEKSFNQAYIYGKLADKSKKMTISKSNLVRKGLLYTPDEDNTHLYLKKDRPNDPSTNGYNKAIQESYIGLLKDLSVLKKAKLNSTQAADRFKKIFDEKFDFENQKIEQIEETGRNKSSPVDIALTKVKKNYKRASVAWANNEVKKAYEEYIKTAKVYTDELEKVKQGEGLDQNGILYIFYTRDIFAAANPKAKVYAYSDGKGICHVFGVALSSEQPKEFEEIFGKKTPEVVKGENLKTILHEMGHNLGLLHSFDAEDIYDGLPPKSEEEKNNKEAKERVTELEGDKEEGDLGEIKTTEQKLEVLKDKETDLAKVDQLQDLKEKYDKLARRLRTTGDPIIKEPIIEFITDKIIPLENKLSTESASNTPINEIRKKQEVDRLQKELEKMKKELEEKNKKVKDAKILPYGKDQGKTVENYMDYPQDSKGTPISGFERKNFYGWQWEVMRPDGKRYNQYLIPKKISEK